MIIAVDFDGTICQTAFPHIGAQIGRSIEILKWAQNLGHIIILWTARVPEAAQPHQGHSASLEAAVEWCANQGLHFDAVNQNVDPEQEFGNPKIVADWYIDDRAKPPSQRGDLTMFDWEDIERELKEHDNA